MPATNKAFTTEDTESTEEYPIVFLSDLRVLGNCSCVALPPVTHMDVGNAKAMLEHRWPSMQSCASCARAHSHFIAAHSMLR